MDSSQVLQLFAHNIEHPNLRGFLVQHQMSEYYAEDGWHHYQNPDKTLQLDFCSCTPKTFNKNYMQPLIDRFGNPLALDENLKGKDRLFLASVGFYPEFSGALPFDLTLDMDKDSLTQTLQTAPIEITNPVQMTEYSISGITYHICPHSLDIVYKNDELSHFYFSFTQDWQVEIHNLYEQYPNYGQRKSKTQLYKFWRSEQRKKPQSLDN